MKDSPKQIALNTQPAIFSFAVIFIEHPSFQKKSSLAYFILVNLIILKLFWKVNGQISQIFRTDLAFSTKMSSCLDITFYVH